MWLKRCALRPGLVGEAAFTGDVVADGESELEAEGREGLVKVVAGSMVLFRGVVLLLLALSLALWISSSSSSSS